MTLPQSPVCSHVQKQPSPAQDQHLCEQMVTESTALERREQKCSWWPRAQLLEPGHRSQSRWGCGSHLCAKNKLETAGDANSLVFSKGGHSEALKLRKRGWGIECQNQVDLARNTELNT